MKTVLILAGLVAVALAGAIPAETNYKTQSVDAKFVSYQKKVLSLFYHVTQVDYTAEYYTIGKDYDIEANIENYTNKQAVEEFLQYWKYYGLLPQGKLFSVFDDEIKEEAVALYHLFYYAKDFETFYKTAAWARVHLNEGMFVYSFSIAVLHRPDTQGIILPAPYEIYPYYFVNSDVISKMSWVKMQEGELTNEELYKYGITKVDNIFTVTANYSGHATNDNEEQKLTYFTEDIGLNTYYYYFHAAMPFWMNGERFGLLKERRGEMYFYIYQQLLARYYMERLTNGLGEIQKLSWRWPVKTGYTPNLVHHSFVPFAQRNNYYNIENFDDNEEIKHLETFENQFVEFLDKTHFKTYNTEVDFRNPSSINFVGNYWEANDDIYHKVGTKNYQKYYEIISRVLLGAAPGTVGKYEFTPTALTQFETALRDPAFFQLYKRIMYYFLEYKQHLAYYTIEELIFEGVKINDVKVDKLVTFFDFFNFDATNAVYYSQKQLKDLPFTFKVNQARLNHKNFNVQVEVKSDVATDAQVKIFFGPKYDSNGHFIKFEDNWMNFVELDTFEYKLTTGINSIVRKSEDFFFYKQDSAPVTQLWKWLEEGKIPTDMSVRYFKRPNRLMLPKGTQGGFPFQFFVAVYPYSPVSKELVEFKNFIADNKSFGYPLDRPVDTKVFYLLQNFYFKDVFIFHEGDDYVHSYGASGYEQQHNTVSKQ